MIRTEAEYQASAARVAQARVAIPQYREQLKNEGLSETEIKFITDPMESFYLGMQEEVEYYERLKRGELPEMDNLQGLGFLLISMRVAKGLSQRDLAQKLGVHESQVSRDERNDYYGITVERAARILDAMNVRLKTVVESVPAKNIVESKPPRSVAAAKSKPPRKMSPPATRRRATTTKRRAVATTRQRTARAG